MSIIDDMEQIEPGTVLSDRYRIEEVLGEGGFAAVYGATDVATNRSVAVKVMDERLLESSRSVARFEREVEVVARLQDPHTVKLLGRGETPSGAPFIVFERVPGRDLSEVLAADGSLSPDIVVHLCRQVLLSLREAHRNGVIHRDLKPANIRVFEYDGDPWRVKVLDFGVALKTGPDVARLTADNEMVGTPRYMSPEQLLGEDPGPASDVYSLGIVAFEMIVGQEALHGVKWGDQLARLQSGYHFTTPQTSEHGELFEVVERMTARKLEHRFNSADAVLRALDELEVARDEAAPRPAAAVPEQPAPGTVVERPVEPTSEPSGLGVPNWLLASGVAVVLVALAAAGLAVLDSLEPEQDGVPSASNAAPTTRSPQVPIRPATDAATSAGDVGAVADAAGLDAAGLDAAAIVGGCGTEPGWTGAKTFHGDRFGSRDRSSTIYLPKRYDPSRRHPVILLFHTMAGTPFGKAWWLLESTRIYELADREGAIVMSFARPPAVGRLLNAGRPAGFERLDLVFVLRDLARARQLTCIDTDRLFALGHGTSTRFVRWLGCKMNLAAIALTGDIEQEGDRCQSDEPVPVIRVSGDLDQYAPVAGGPNCTDLRVRSRAEIEADWMASNRCDEATKSVWRKERGGTCWTYDCDAQFVACHTDGGHFFPSSPTTDELPQCGRDQKTAFPIMEAIWSFWMAQTTE